ncbi:family 12 glycoside hydrolase [Melampsora larici-populina 98AG31]|uniref:Family 12 glycoside hydrolase n=1 Tax=Melampsora larici-populina (strain 98AG31 / pathotype 3-4-7) TaxID=747676 RepID=F4R8P5_MELLP|nr:family 12 glycoside hydrolase [Melampsora larici-populina 98AG31]EGG11080.1 family 12 glycoside hydrolase [Melampsora larici-populina 98AG31]
MFSSATSLSLFVLFLSFTSTLGSSLTPVSKKSVKRSLAKRNPGPWYFEYYKPMSGASEATLLEPKYILENMIYNSGMTVGKQTTQLLEWKADMVHWRNDLDIANQPATENVPKSYAFVGMVSDMNQPITAYRSIPVEYYWQRTNSQPTKANVCLDFVISLTNNKNPDHELMLWLEKEGGQKPIGYGGKTVRVENLYGRSWTLYEGPNKSNNNVMVRTLVPDEDFSGSFIGDAREWLMKLVELKRFPASAYVSVANMGMEAFWGKSHFEARSKMNFLWSGNNFQAGYTPPGFKKPTPGSSVPGF